MSKKNSKAVEAVKDREIAQAMMILLGAVEVGPNVERLAELHGFSPLLVRSFAERMREAGLWTADSIDDREWWAENGELRGVGLFAHALVATGRVQRRVTSIGADYIDTATGQVCGRWRIPEIIH